MSNIEPTEEQKQAAERFIIEGVMHNAAQQCSALARLLAEREAKLREYVGQLEDQATGQQDLVDTLRARVAEAESALAIYVANDEKADTLLKRAGLDDTTNVVPRLAALVDETAALRARVAELEVYADTAMRNRDAHAAARDELEEREAQHILDIKALRDALTQGYALSLNARDRVLAATAHYDDAKADAKVAVVTLEVKQATPDMIRAAAATPYLGHNDAKADAPRECGHPCCGQTCGPREDRKVHDTEGGEG